MLASPAGGTPALGQEAPKEPAVNISHNTPSADVKALPRDLEDRVLAALPAPLRRWVLEDAPWDADVGGLFRKWRAGATVEGLLREMRTVARRDTAAVYGRAHPQAEYSTAA